MGCALWPSHEPKAHSSANWLQRGARPAPEVHLVRNLEVSESRLYVLGPALHLLSHNTSGSHAVLRELDPATVAATTGWTNRTLAQAFFARERQIKTEAAFAAELVRDQNIRHPWELSHQDFSGDEDERLDDDRLLFATALALHNLGSDEIGATLEEHIESALRTHDAYPEIMLDRLWEEASNLRAPADMLRDAVLQMVQFVARTHGVDAKDVGLRVFVTQAGDQELVVLQRQMAGLRTVVLRPDRSPKHLAAPPLQEGSILDLRSTRTVSSVRKALDGLRYQASNQDVFELRELSSHRHGNGTTLAFRVWATEPRSGDEIYVGHGRLEFSGGTILTSELFLDGRDPPTPTPARVEPRIGQGVATHYQSVLSGVVPVGTRRHTYITNHDGRLALNGLWDAVLRDKDYLSHPGRTLGRELAYRAMNQAAAALEGREAELVLPFALRWVRAGWVLEGISGGHRAQGSRDGRLMGPFTREWWERHRGDPISGV